MTLRMIFIVLFFLSLANVYAQDPDSKSKAATDKISDNSSRDCIDLAKRNSKVQLACSAPIDPVCGCDGVTYDNFCRAENAGVRRFNPGPCTVKTGTGVTAPNDECIDLAKRNSKVQVACSAPIDPVCGCDGITYDNSCRAENAGVRRFVKGKCGQKGDDPTPADDCKGKAVKKTCTSLFEPVCGCDGQTYSNACVAEAAGVKRFKKGECGKKADDPTSNGGWNDNNNSWSSSNDNNAKGINRNLQGCEAIWDHIKNWKGKNGESGAAKISFEVIPNESNVVQVKEFKKSKGGKVLDVKVLNPNRLLKSNSQVVKESNLNESKIILDPVKIEQAAAQDSSNVILNQNFKDNVFVLNAENNELKINDKKGNNLFTSQLTFASGKNEIWGLCEMNNRRYVIKLNWTRGEIGQSPSFKEVK